MIHIVCGLIGSGKSTYALKQKGIITECQDGELPISKDEQILKTLEAYDQGRDVWHVTCFPTWKELDAFRYLEKEFVWINTSPRQAMSNILSRKRKRDLDNLKETRLANEDIYDKYMTSGIPFRVVDLFETGERW